ncbi:unnamed protein product [Urochloa decumbens]|uniref:RING-type E3 ubiquitin transferase n=1 Tax=Urochloa decumbens TaxID=240449 RepID=A0ABC9AXA8_9POAL
MPLPPPEEKPRPEPRPKPPKPKPKTGPEPKPMPGSERYWTPGGAIPPDPISCAGSCAGACVLLPHCSQPPPASPAATVHISSSRLPTPLIALSASLLALSAVLLLAVLLHRLARRRRRRRAQNAAALAAAHHDAEGGHHVLAAGAAAAEEDEEAGVHHVWYIRTKGLDERAIAAIAAVVYDAGSKKRAGAGEGDGGGDDGSCAVCLAEFRHGETLRLLPRCGHAFHRGCIDTWLRAHVNCPLCRAPVQVAAGAGDADTAAAGAPGGAPPERNPRAAGGGGVVRAEGAERGGGGGLQAERGVRRAASMVALPRRSAAGWPDASSFRAPASSSGREGDMTGLGKIMRLLKFSDSALEMASVGAGAGRSVSFGGGSCQRLPAAGVGSDEMQQ